MEFTSVYEQDGLKIVQVCSGFVEVYFDWSKLPDLDLSEHYYCIRANPKTSLLPVEYARPNSEGPLFLHLAETVIYQIELIQLSHLTYTVQSALKQLPWVDLVSQHENLHKLVWSNTEINGAGTLEIWADGELQGSVSSNDPAVFHVKGRPEFISLKTDKGEELFKVITNLAAIDIVRSTDFEIKKVTTKLSFYTAISPSGGWKVRAEMNPSFKIRELWQRFYCRRFPDCDRAKIVGSFRMIEDGKVVGTVRQFGFWTRVRDHMIEKIQLEEWNLSQRKPLEGIRLQLQITSAHRELYRFVLAEKEENSSGEISLIGFSEEEIQEAEAALAAINNRVSWDQAHLELVLWFKTDDTWHEFQRDNAHNLRWEFFPSHSTRQARCEWILSSIDNGNRELVVLKSGTENRPEFSAEVFLQPFSATHLVAIWELDQKKVEDAIKAQWRVELREVGFHLKVHEEYLGVRTARPDLDVHIPDIFSPHQNIYFEVDPDKCFSAEIVARHYNFEFALTPVSSPVVVPRLQPTGRAVESYQKPGHWFHNSQREVKHQVGKDSYNKAKVILHLHFHSPNLFRADPFRESFLKDTEWPIKTAQGDEVHNPPGEWILKNCMDSWLPILRMFRKLAFEGVDYQFSLNITPPVAYVVSSPRFKDYMSRYLLRVQAFIRSQIALIKNRQDSQDYLHAAQRYLEDVRALDLFYNQEIHKDIVGAFSDLEKKGYLEISTCTATHGMPAELAAMSDALNAQVALAARSHHRLFGGRPQGIWLAENSFFPGAEQFVSSEFFNYFFVESESVLWGSAASQEEEFNPVMIPGTGVAAIPRSRLGRSQVWDADIGYAGHPDFREFHFRHLGLPLKRITSKDSDEKQAYNPDQGEETARVLARDFYNKLCDKAHELGQRVFRTIPLITCSYDAELFGHHWSEGPYFLEELIREIHRKSDVIGLTTPSHYLVDAEALPEVMPNPSTWGHEATHVKWSDPKVIWSYKEIKRAEKLLNVYLKKALEGELQEWQKEMVEQMAAELIRAQSSDLTFVIMAGSFEEDMQREILKYLDYFYKLKHLIDNNNENRDFLNFRKYENDMFPEIKEFYNIRQ